MSKWSDKHSCDDCKWQGPAPDKWCLLSISPVFHICQDWEADEIENNAVGFSDKENANG